MTSIRIHFLATIQNNAELFKKVTVPPSVPGRKDGQERLLFCGLEVYECPDGYFYEFHGEPSFLRLPEAARVHVASCTMRSSLPLLPRRERGIYRHPEHGMATGRLERNECAHVFNGKAPSPEALCELADLILAGKIAPAVSHDGPQSPSPTAPASEPWRDELRRLEGRLDAVEAELRAVRRGTFARRFRTEAVALRDRARTAATEAVAYAHAALLEVGLGGIPRRPRP